MDKAENAQRVKATVKLSDIGFTPIWVALIAVIITIRMYQYFLTHIFIQML